MILFRHRWAVAGRRGAGTGHRAVSMPVNDRQSLCGRRLDRPRLDPRKDHDVVDEARDLQIANQAHGPVAQRLNLHGRSRNRHASAVLHERAQQRFHLGIHQELRHGRFIRGGDEDRIVERLVARLQLLAKELGCLLCKGLPGKHHL